MTAGEGETALAMDRLPHAHPLREAGAGLDGTGQAWFARGRDGHPWLIASDDLERFRAAVIIDKQHQPV